MDIEDIVDVEGSDDESTQRMELEEKKWTAIRKNFKKREKQNKTFDREYYTPNVIPGTQKIYVKTFGCSHNMSDSEFMMGQLVDYGYTLTDEPLESDLILINSCTVKNPSQENLMRMVFNSKEIKKPCVVAGCVPQGDPNIEGLQDVSIVGITQIDRVVEVVEETLKGNIVQLLKKKALPSLDLPKIRRNKFIEIIAVNTGCLGNCTYCKTKHARGHLGSYQPAEIKARMLSAFEEGVTEIWLTSEDTGAYGRDINTSIVDLLLLLIEAMPEGKMLRVGMTNPPYILEHLEGITHIMNHPQVFKYLHLPVQAGNNHTLERMNREYTVEEFSNVAQGLLDNVADMTISTDFICGFPGETEEEFLGSLALIEKFRFPVINISKFYPRPGTVAERMKPCDTKVKKDRSKRMTLAFEGYKNMDMLMGKEVRVYISEWEDHPKSGKIVIGHTQNYSKVVIPYEESLLGTQVIMKITKCLKWHVEGEIIDRKPAFLKADEACLDKVKAIYDGLQKKKDAILAKRRAERKIRLRALRKDAQKKARAKIDAEKAAAKLKDEKAANPDPVPTAVQNKMDEEVSPSDNNAMDEEEIKEPESSFMLLIIGIALLILGYILKQQGL